MAILLTLVSYVEPGGYLQWDELDVPSMRAVEAATAKPHPACDEFLEKAKQWFKLKGTAE